jgi:hypothetical protein
MAQIDAVSDFEARHGLHIASRLVLAAEQLCMHVVYHWQHPHACRPTHVLAAVHACMCSSALVTGAQGTAQHKAPQHTSQPRSFNSTLCQLATHLPTLLVCHSKQLQPVHYSSSCSQSWCTTAAAAAAKAGAPQQQLQPIMVHYSSSSYNQSWLSPMPHSQVFRPHHRSAKLCSHQYPHAACTQSPPMLCSAGATRLCWVPLAA